MSAPVTVTVKLFATLRSQAGWSERAFTLPAGSTLGALVAAVEESAAGLARALCCGQSSLCPGRPRVGGGRRGGVVPAGFRRNRSDDALAQAF